MNIQIPEGVRYTCTQCGECCRRYSILLGPGEKERIDGLDWTGRRPELAGAPTTELIRDRGFQGRARLRQRPDGSCVFLGDQNQCLIHEQFGGEVKPLICRLYPFAFIPLGERVCLDVSFACRAVSQEHGEPVGERTPEWALLLQAGADAKDRARHRLRKDSPLTPDLLWELEHILLEFLTDRSMPLDVRIRCVAQFLYVGTSGKADSPVAREYREGMVRGILKQARENRLPADQSMDRTQSAFFHQWLYLALNPIPAAFHSLPPEEQKREQQTRLERGERFRDHKDRPWVDNRELACDFTQVDRVDPGLFRKPEFVFPETWLCAKILGQRFLRFGTEELPLVEGMHRFLLNYPMLIWTSKALAADRGAEAVEPDDARHAIRLLDRFSTLLPLVTLPVQMIRAWEFLVEETDFVLAAMNDVMK